MELPRTQNLTISYNFPAHQEFLKQCGQEANHPKDWGTFTPRTAHLAKGYDWSIGAPWYDSLVATLAITSSQPLHTLEPRHVTAVVSEVAHS